MTTSPVLKLSHSPSIAGTDRPIRVGRRTFVFPSGLRYAHSDLYGEKLLFVLDVEHDNKLYAFVEQGEVRGIPEPVAKAIIKKIFKVAT